MPCERLLMPALGPAGISVLEKIFESEVNKLYNIWTVMKILVIFGHHKNNLCSIQEEGIEAGFVCLTSLTQADICYKSVIVSNNRDCSFMASTNQTLTRCFFPTVIPQKDFVNCKYHMTWQNLYLLCWRSIFTHFTSHEQFHHLRHLLELLEIGAQPQWCDAIFCCSRELGRSVFEALANTNVALNPPIFGRQA